MALVFPSIFPPLVPQFSTNCKQPPSLSFYRSLRHFPAKSRTRTRTTVPFALAESDSPKSLESAGAILPFLQELAESFDLPPDYLAKLPRDLRLDVSRPAPEIRST